MKLFLLLILAFLNCDPVGAQAENLALHTAHDEAKTVHSVHPTTTDGVDLAFNRSTVSLRESLRYPLLADGTKPFRLSPEERVRLREQVRSHSSIHIISSDRP